MDNIYNTGVVAYIILEVTFAWLQPYVPLEGVTILTDWKWQMISMQYDINVILLSPVLIRCYVIYRFFISCSTFYDERADRIT
jgi:hypothetical protein